MHRQPERGGFGHVQHVRSNRGPHIKGAPTRVGFPIPDHFPIPVSGIEKFSIPGSRDPGGIKGLAVLPEIGICFLTYLYKKT